MLAWSLSDIIFHVFYTMERRPKGLFFFFFFFYKIARGSSKEGLMRVRLCLCPDTRYRRKRDD